MDGSMFDGYARGLFLMGVAAVVVAIALGVGLTLGVQYIHHHLHVIWS